MKGLKNQVNVKTHCFLLLTALHSKSYFLSTLGVEELDINTIL